MALAEQVRTASLSRRTQDPSFLFSTVAASVCRIRLESTSLAEIHPQKPLPVQVLVRGELLAFRIHDVCPHHAQHTLLGHAGKDGDTWKRGSCLGLLHSHMPQILRAEGHTSQEAGFDFLMSLGCSLAESCSHDGSLRSLFC